MLPNHVLVKSDLNSTTPNHRIHPELVKKSTHKSTEKKPKFYAVRSGREPGIYTAWDEAEKQINDGYKKPEHKSFLTRAEAERYMNGDDTNKRTIRFVKIEKQLDEMKEQMEEQKKHIAALSESYNNLRNIIASASHFAPAPTPTPVVDNNVILAQTQAQPKDDVKHYANEMNSFTIEAAAVERLSQKRKLEETSL